MTLKPTIRDPHSSSSSLSDPLPQGIQTLLEQWRTPLMNQTMACPCVSCRRQRVRSDQRWECADQLEALAPATLQEEESKKR